MARYLVSGDMSSIHTQTLKDESAKFINLFRKVIFNNITTNAMTISPEQALVARQLAALECLELGFPLPTALLQS